MYVKWTQDAWNEYTGWQSKDKAVLRKINELVKDIMRNKNYGIGRPEPLKHEMSGLWSRRITDEHRLVYRLENDELIIYSCERHCQD